MNYCIINLRLNTINLFHSEQFQFNCVTVNLQIHSYDDDNTVLYNYIVISVPTGESTSRDIAIDDPINGVVVRNHMLDL